MGEYLLEDMFERDARGLITSSDVKRQEDASALLEVGFISPELGLAVAEAKSGEINPRDVWSLMIGEEEEYLEDLGIKSLSSIPGGWAIYFGDMDGVDGEGGVSGWLEDVPIPGEYEELKVFLTLTPPQASEG